MIRRYLGEYGSFKCLAEKCPDTCCSGWVIQIDEDSLEWYKSLEKEQPELMRDRIDWTEGCFCNRENGDCAFLREDGLCEMQKTLGEEALCYTCDMYPRHVEEFPNVREYSLSVSCPSNALALVNMTSHFELVESEDDEPDNPDDYDDFNDLLFAVLQRCRSSLIGILKISGITFDEKAKLIVGTMYRVQELLDEGDWSLVNEVLDEPVAGERTLGAEEYREILSKLEPLDEDFAMLMQSLLSDVNEEDVHGYDELCTYLCEYFIYTYFCGAAYNGFVYALAAEAVFFAKCIRYMICAAGAESAEDIAKLIYKFSRELEHSDDNLNALQEMMDEISV